MASRTFAIQGGTALTSRSSKQGRASFVCMAGVQVVEASAIARVGTDSARGTAWLPPARIPMGTADVKMSDGSTQTVQVMVDPQWYRGFDEGFNRRLGGVIGQSVVDVANNADAAIGAASQATQQVASVAQDVGAVQAAAIATKQVLVASDVPGADQIPSVTSGGNLL